MYDNDASVSKLPINFAGYWDFLLIISWAIVVLKIFKIFLLILQFRKLLYGVKLTPFIKYLCFPTFLFLLQLFFFFYFIQNDFGALAIVAALKQSKRSALIIYHLHLGTILPIILHLKFQALIPVSTSFDDNTTVP